MDLFKILGRLAENPNAVKMYRDLQAYYEQAGRNEDAQAVNYLIETKFGKKNDAGNITNAGEGSQTGDSSVPGVSQGD
jgi:hypothetical protein